MVVVVQEVICILRKLEVTVVLAAVELDFRQPLEVRHLHLGKDMLVVMGVAI